MSYTIANTMNLRNIYGDYRTLAINANRDLATENQLGYADSYALRRAVRELDDFDFADAEEAEDEDGIEAEIRAFVDTYNYTLDSTSELSDSDVKKYSSKLKSLIDEYADDLEDIGITKRSDGYLKLSSSSVENISASTFESFFDKDTKFMKQVKKYAKQLSNHIDYYA